MTAFVKFDPWAAIAAARQEFRNSPAADKPKTFATFAHSHAAHPKTQNLDIGNSPVTTKGPHGTKNEIPAGRLAKAAKAAKVDAEPFPFADALNELERRCPEYVEPGRWQQCVTDASRFIASWGDKAAALGWTADDLFGLHEPPAKPRPSYSRLSRYDCTGLLWLLDGRRVVALTADTAAIEGHTGNIVTYRKHRKPALGPLGDSLDDFTGGDPPEAA